MALAKDRFLVRAYDVEGRDTLFHYENGLEVPGELVVGVRAVIDYAERLRSQGLRAAIRPSLSWELRRRLKGLPLGDLE